MTVAANGILDNPYDTEKLELTIPSVAARLWRNLKDNVRPALFVKGGRQKPLHRTAYLDGIRGFAAFLVYWHHHHRWSWEFQGYVEDMENGFGYNGKYFFAQLPFVRLFVAYGGHFAVAVFYVLSGYVLSTKALGQIHGREYEKLQETVASAFFRRWLRLWMPVFITTFSFLTLQHTFRIYTDPPRGPTYGSDIWKWYTKIKNFSYIFDSSGDPFFEFNDHIWSIPVEMRGSIVVYTCCMAFSRCTRNARLWLIAGVGFYFMYIADGSHNAMFMSGMMLSELDLLARGNNLPHWINRLSEYKEVAFYHLLVLSLYLAGVPSETSDVKQLRSQWGWYYLSFLKPQAVFNHKWFFLFWAATFFVASVRHIWWLRAFFESRFNQYLGRVSFALYLVHGPMLQTVGDRLYVMTGYIRPHYYGNLDAYMNLLPIPHWGPIGLELSFLVPNLICLPLTLWVAEMVTKMVDTPTVKFGQWLYRKTLGSSGKS